ncbi:MAG: hypothetical protein ABFD82_23505 [Syntrophaceae bacterium]
MNNRNRGKATERDLAKRLGMKRVGVLGKEDLNDGTFSVEVKNRVKSTAHNFMAQCIRNAPIGKTPLVIIHKHKDPHGEDLVCMRLRDWEAWNGLLNGVYL